MMAFRWIGAAAALALLGACEAKIGDGSADANSAAPANVSAEGKAEEGQLSIKAPGFDLKLDIPTGVSNEAQIDSDSRIMYPGAKLAGMHVEATGKAGGDRSAVELRFTSPDAPAQVANWYRDPARADGFTLRSTAPEGAGWAIAGTDKENGDPFTVRLAPAAGGGTDGRLTLEHGRR